MSKFLNDKDFFICTGGLAPAQMQALQKVAGKKNFAAKFITKTDTNTSSWIDFSCKKMMLLMAVIAVVVCLLVVATGGAALIAAACIGGAIGAAAGALICGQQASAARKWVGYKTNVKLLGIEMLTDKASMECSIFGETIRYAPHIKNWWQAIAVGIKNFVGEMFKCALIGAGVAGIEVLATEGAAAFLSNAAANYAATWTTGWGLGFRGVMGAMDGITQKYENGASTEDAIGSGIGSGLWGMEKGTATSAYNVATGQGTAEDYAGLLAWGAPVARTNEEGRNTNTDIDPMKDGNWEGKPQSGKTGYLESPRMSRAEVQAYKAQMKAQGIDVVIDNKGVLPDNARAGFDPNTGKIYLRKGATQYEAFHEQQHAQQWNELGADAYKQQSRMQREQHVYDQIMKSKGQFSQAELDHALSYMNDVRNQHGADPLDAMEDMAGKGGAEFEAKVKDAADGDLYEDPSVVKTINTLNENLNGKNHPVTDVPFSEKIVDLNGEKVKGVFPEFESKFDCTLSSDKLKATDYKQFKESTQQLKRAIEADPSLKQKFTESQLEDIMNEEPYIDDLTWHHKEAPPGKMQLIDRDIHNKTNHTGGKNIWGGGNENR